ncbi:MULTISPECIES: hypothetical protein [Olivibacter]|jgi:hypothetical protein|uniref:Uncharacterized protein n=2 Tax=Olivibacter TaxID=376469 RepID=A0ABV6HP30_9SPHI|nr:MULTISPECIES: hypothetical protein [Olivibacter]MCL4638210.1 hypothetical protein [Olivibacter sp. UJ_SKK_5.1]MDM8173308.1 hypothetical protein [Olivibacter sp. 47]QEL03087.1 hypothetical protein FKG96_20415 [Olivibacter sp. LS-1]
MQTTTKDLSELLKARDQMMAAIAFTIAKDIKSEKAVEVTQQKEQAISLHLLDLINIDVSDEYQHRAL